MGLQRKIRVAKSGKKTDHKDVNFLGLGIAVWDGGLPRERVGVKNFVPPLESLFSLGFEEVIWDAREFSRDVPDPWRCSKVCIFRSLLQRDEN